MKALLCDYCLAEESEITFATRRLKLKQGAISASLEVCEIHRKKNPKSVKEMDKTALDAYSVKANLEQNGGQQ